MKEEIASSDEAALHASAATPKTHRRAVSSTSIFKAVAKGDLTLVRMYLEGGNAEMASVRDWQQRTPLMKAAELGQAAVLKVLIDVGLDVNVRDVSGYTALALACQKSKADCVVLLLGAADCDVRCRTELQRETPLHLAVAQAEYNPEAVTEIVKVHTYFFYYIKVRRYSCIHAADAHIVLLLAC
jgi:ankyrin repeat protein